MRFGTHSRYALTRLLAVSAMAATLGGAAAVAQDGGSWRYDRYLQQERAKAQQQLITEGDRSTRDQRATIGVEERRSTTSGSSLRDSLHYFGSKPRSGHADR